MLRPCSPPRRKRACRSTPGAPSRRWGWCYRPRCLFRWGWICGRRTQSPPVWATTSLQGWTIAASCTCASGHRTRRGWVGTTRWTRSATPTSWSGGVGGERASGESDVGRVTLTVAPGRSVLLAHAHQGDTLGRQELGITLRSFQVGPAISDLLLAQAWRDDTLIDRSAMLGHLQRGLTFGAGDTVRVYVEVYGLRVSAERVSYHVTYRMLRSDDLQRDIAREEWPGAIGHSSRAISRWR